MSAEETEEAQDLPSPFGRQFQAHNDVGEESFSIHVVSPYTSVEHDDFGKHADLYVHSADATLQVSLVSFLTKGELLRLSQWIREVAMELKDEE